MKNLSFLVIAVILSFSSPAFSFQCIFQVVSVDPIDPIKILTVDTGLTSNLAIHKVTSITNFGAFDSRVKVKGEAIGEPKWETLNAGETYPPFGMVFVMLQEVLCLQTSTGSRSLPDQIVERVDNMVDATSEDIIGTLEEAKDIFVGNLTWMQIGRARNCPLNMGNQDDQQIPVAQPRLIHRGARANVNKFKNLRISSNFDVMNNYLLMQAANKTYYKQFKYSFNPQILSWRTARTEEQYRCAATELYRYWGFKDVMFVNIAGANAIIAGDSDKYIVTVRGTQIPDEGQIKGEQSMSPAETLIDLATNMSNLMIDANVYGINRIGKVHAGYATSAVLLSSLVQRSLQLMEYNNEALFITGHSLGGAIATVLAKHLDNNNFPIQAAYVYAPPKVGDSVFNSGIRENLPLFVTWNYRDPVPTLSRSDAPNPFSSLYQLTMEAARTVVFFDQQHVPHLINTSRGDYNMHLREIRELQGAPYPHVISDEWFFHSGNFYIAFTYQHLLNSESRTVTDSAIEPEFQRLKICLFWEYSVGDVEYDWNADFRRYVRDKSAYPLMKCVH